MIALDDPAEGRDGAPHRVDHGSLQGQGPARHASSTAATRTSRCTRATGRSSASAGRWICRALRIDTAYNYDFAEPIFRLGNDYSKGIILSTGYVGQRTPNGLVTCLTDGHPGVSGGGVLNQQGDLVGIPIGRMQGDYRFSFILPVRPEMFRKVPGPDDGADDCRLEQSNSQNRDVSSDRG